MDCKPKLRFPEFSGKWEETQLNKLLSFKNGLNASKEKYGKGMKFINVSDILNNDFLTYDNIEGSVEVSKEQLDNYLVTYGDVLFQRSSETREEVGTSNVYLDPEIDCVFGGFVIRGKKIADYDPFFLKELLTTSSVRKEITSRSGGSTRYNIGQESLKIVEIKIPSIPEQEKIASFLSKVDSKIDLLEKKQELWETYKKGIMQQIFSQKLRFKDENGEDYPDWEEKKLDEIADICGGGTPSTGIKEYWNGSINWFTPSEVGKDKYLNSSIRKISDSGLKNSSAKLLPFGTLLVSSRATIGEISILTTTGTTNQGFQSLIIKKNYDNEFIYYLGNILKKEMIRRASGSTFLEISKNEVRKITIKVPFLAEQIMIAEFLSAIDTKIKGIGNELEIMNKFKKGLLEQMFC